MKTYGKIELIGKRWSIQHCQPHVSIKLKSIFQKIPKTALAPYWFENTPEHCSDLLWFMKRYPLEISNTDFDTMADGETAFNKRAAEMEAIFLPGYKATSFRLRDGEVARDYQQRAADLHYLTKRLLLGDDLGLGKTLSGILTLMNPGTMPALIVVQTHLTRQWKAEIEKFTYLGVHIINGTSPYNLPAADVYIIKYSCLSGWVNMFNQGYWKSVIFDEVQELRRSDSMKYRASKVICDNVDYCLGLSATPIYNYGDEIFNILNLLKPGCLGNWSEFAQEWVEFRHMKCIIKDPKALGTYLRDNYLFLRRSRAEVGMELPAINKIIHTVGYDGNEVKKIDELANQLALRILHGTFIERGSAARELDLLVRHQTGVAKAREVAEYVKIILSNNEPVVLAGWHRDVYDIWKEHLAEFNPVFYTGSESESQKEKAKNAFIAGETNLFIISLRSGIGLDGLQKRCKTMVIGELDWSPKVHEQLIGRVDRPGQEDQVTVIFPVCEYGSDPVIIDLLGLKASQSHAIVNPLTAPVVNVSDDSRMKILAEKFLKKSK